MKRAIAFALLAGCGGVRPPAPPAPPAPSPPKPARYACAAWVDTEPVPGAVYDSWRFAWQALPEYEANAPVPETEAEARAALCGDRCDGDGPWILVSGGAAEPVFHLGFQTPEGLLVFKELARRNPACPERPVVTLASTSPVRVHAESPCADGPTTYEDYVVDLDVRLRVLSVTRRGLGVDPIALDVSNDRATIAGAGCHAELPLSIAAPQ